MIENLTEDEIMCLKKYIVGGFGQVIGRT